jgi:hypothetical protein
LPVRLKSATNFIFILGRNLPIYILLSNITQNTVQGQVDQNSLLSHKILHDHAEMVEEYRYEKKVIFYLLKKNFIFGQPQISGLKLSRFRKIKKAIFQIFSIQTLLYASRSFSLL